MMSSIVTIRVADAVSPGSAMSRQPIMSCAGTAETRAGSPFHSESAPGATFTGMDLSSERDRSSALIVRPKSIITISRGRLRQILDRFYFEPTCGCWIWGGSDSGNGFGKVSICGIDLMVHRVVYEALVGPIPPGLVLDHRCRLRRCGNPDHLEPVTVQVNTRRGDAVLFGENQ